MTDQIPNSSPNSEWTLSLETLGESISQWMSQLGIGADADIHTSQLSEPVAGARRAKIALDLTVGRVQLSALPPDSDALIEAEVTSIGIVEMNTAVEGDMKSVRLRQKRTNVEEDPLKSMKDAVDTVARNPELAWNIRLNPNIPLTLEIKAELTVDTLNLTGLNVSRLTLDGGTGSTQVTLPAGQVTAEIDGGLGILEIVVPDDARCNLSVHIGAGATTLLIGNANVKADIEGGLGNCNIVVPETLPMRVQAESGLGNIEVPESLSSVHLESEFISESGMWQSEGYELAPKKFDLRYDGGVGSLIVQHPTVDATAPTDE